MQTPRPTPDASALPGNAALAVNAIDGVLGQRAVITFAPKPASPETLCAGVVVRTDSGDVAWRTAIDPAPAQFAFGAPGAMLADIAQHLCQSLAAHWAATPSAGEWKPPFHAASLADVHRFSARNVDEALTLLLGRASSLHTLLAQVKLAPQRNSRTLVEQVRRAMAQDPNARHLAPRFNRELMVGGGAQPLRVDFLGQHYACNLLQITRNARLLDVSIERAYGKLYELQALRQWVKKPPRQLGLLDEERPRRFELIMVADRGDQVHRRALAQIEALADQNEVRAEVRPHASAAAVRVAEQERLAA